MEQVDLILAEPHDAAGGDLMHGRRRKLSFNFCPGQQSPKHRAGAHAQVIDPAHLAPTRQISGGRRSVRASKHRETTLLAQTLQAVCARLNGLPEGWR